MEKKKSPSLAGSTGELEKGPAGEPQELPLAPAPISKLVRQKTLDVPDRDNEMHSVNLKDFHDEVSSNRLRKSEKLNLNGIPNNLFDIRETNSPNYVNVAYLSNGFREGSLKQSKFSHGGGLSGGKRRNSGLSEGGVSAGGKRRNSGTSRNSQHVERVDSPAMSPIMADRRTSNGEAGHPGSCIK